MADTTKKIEEAIEELNEKYGESSIMKMDEDHDFKIEAFKTDCLGLDYVLGCGGLPKGRIIEVHGMPSSGKSSLSFYLASRVQKAGGVVVWIDAESCMSADYAKSLGVDMNQLIISQPDHGEAALDVIEKMSKAGVDLIVVDSVASLIPKKDLEGEVDGTEQIALQARMLSRGLRRLTMALGKSNTSVLFINQLRSVIGGYGHGPTKTTPGGNALRFYASIRLEVSKIKTLKDKDDQAIGYIMKMNSVKNKCAPPLRSAELSFMYGKGFDFDGEIIEMGEKFGVIMRSGNTLSYGDLKLGVGVDQAKKKLEGDEKLRKEIKKEIEKKI